MTQPKVVMTHKIPDAGLKKLEETFHVVILDETKPMREQLLKHIVDTEFLVPLLSLKIDAEILDKANQLKLIANYAVGYDNIDLEAARERKILVSNTPDVLTNATADLTWALMLAVSRRIPEADKLCRSNADWKWSPEFHLGTEITATTLGVVGMGRIGSAVAKRAIGFDMTVIYNSRSMNRAIEKQYEFCYMPLNDLLQDADFVSLHVPYTSETHHLIGEEELELMKPSAFLINTARGKVVDEKALIKALQEGKIAGAGLDVYYDEPYIPKALKNLPNVVLTPHIGSATYRARDAMATIVADNILAVHAEESPPNLIPELQ
ncbi:MAG: 2-hydroxyacid dehydrogenase [Candidatus Hermodarchaeota archaeon]